MKSYVAYIRVSTIRQSEEGVSLQEQRRAILEYATRRNITISEWFEEQVSAAKRGRPIFSRMVTLLKAKKAVGLIMHKIDRGSRNLRDWADMAELMDRGIEVQFVHESIDLHTRTGRLSADILAVVAADYIRNLREEVIKGINGRLRQGYFPFAAPVGYLNNGKGKLKTIDPVRGPLVKCAFELYASRLYPLRKLQEEMFSRGLRTKRGKPMSKAHLAVILRNPFYIGIMRIQKRKETYAGIHEPLITSTLFNQVQIILDGKRSKFRMQNRYLLRLMIKCEHCKLCVSGERQKGHVYYRCHRSACPTTCIREEKFEIAMLEQLKRINISPEEEPIVAEVLKDLKFKEASVSQQLIRDTEADLRRVQESLSVLLQRFLDGAITQDTFNDGHSSLLLQRAFCEEKLQNLRSSRSIYKQLEQYCSQLRSLCQMFCTGTQEEMRKIIDRVFQSITTSGNAFTLRVRPHMEEIANRTKTKEAWKVLANSIIKEIAGTKSSNFLQGYQL